MKNQNELLNNNKIKFQLIGTKIGYKKYDLKQAENKLYNLEELLKNDEK